MTSAAAYHRHGGPNNHLVEEDDADGLPEALRGKVLQRVLLNLELQEPRGSHVVACAEEQRPEPEHGHRPHVQADDGECGHVRPQVGGEALPGGVHGLAASLTSVAPTVSR